MKTSEIEGAALDWAVAKCEYPELIWGESIGLSAHGRDLIVIPQFKEPNCYFAPSTNWAQGGPIIEREEIDTINSGKNNWKARIYPDAVARGPTPLIAAMRCYCQSKLGEEVNLPGELQ